MKHRSGVAQATTVSVALGALLLLAGCAAQHARRARATGAPVDGLSRYEFTQPQMGVPFRLVFYARDATSASNAAHAAFQRIAALNQILSDYEDNSELTRLSRTAGTGQAVPLSSDLWRVLERSQRLAASTGGAFDVTVGPAVLLWRRARRQRELPDPKRLALALQAVGHQKLILDPKRHTAKLLAPGMRLDLGGIAKGYAVDEALKTLRAQGIRRALVSGGGDLAVGDPPPGAQGWRIEVAPLDVPEAPPRCFVLLKHCALATSGDLFQHVEIGGQRYSHIVDPRTGMGLTDHSLVSVTAPDCTTADSLATAVSVLGPAAALRLVEATPRAAAHLVRQPADRIEVFESKRFAKFKLPTAKAGAR